MFVMAIIIVEWLNILAALEEEIARAILEP